MSAPPHPHAIILVKEKRHGPSWAAPRSTAPRRDSGQLGGCRTGETKAVGRGSAVQAPTQGAGYVSPRRIRLAGDVGRPRPRGGRDRPPAREREGPKSLFPALGGAALSRPHLPSFPGLRLQRRREEAAGRHRHLRGIRWGWGVVLCCNLSPEPRQQLGLTHGARGEAKEGGSPTASVPGRPAPAPSSHTAHTDGGGCANGPLPPARHPAAGSLATQSPSRTQPAPLGARPGCVGWGPSPASLRTRGPVCQGHAHPTGWGQGSGEGSSPTPSSPAQNAAPRGACPPRRGPTWAGPQLPSPGPSPHRLETHSSPLEPGRASGWVGEGPAPPFPGRPALPLCPVPRATAQAKATTGQAGGPRPPFLTPTPASSQARPFHKLPLRGCLPSTEKRTESGPAPRGGPGTGDTRPGTEARSPHLLPQPTRRPLQRACPRHHLVPSPASQAILRHPQHPHCRNALR